MGLITRPAAQAIHGHVWPASRVQILSYMSAVQLVILTGPFTLRAHRSIAGPATEEEQVQHNMVLQFPNTALRHAVNLFIKQVERGIRTGVPVILFPLIPARCLNGVTLTAGNLFIKIIRAAGSAVRGSILPNTLFFPFSTTTIVTTSTR